jgi:phosphohistidine phosphatase
MLYLMQHGEAFGKAENPDRPLTVAGRHNVLKVARLAHLVKAKEVLHSGKLRAQQTAEIMAEALGVPCLSRDDIGPNDAVPPVAQWLKAQPPLLLVGHLPFLSRLLGYIVDGEESADLVAFRNAGLLCIEESKLCWILWPEMIEAN